MKASTAVIILSMAFINGCGHHVSEPNWILEKMYTSEVEIQPAATAGEPLFFTVKSGFPNTCWQFSHLRIVSSGFDVYVTPYMKRPIGEMVCLEFATPVAEEGQFVPVFPGVYRFHFWRFDSFSLNYTVTVQ